MTAATAQRTKTTHHRSEHGSWSRATREPDPRLRPFLQRAHIGADHQSAAFESWLEPPQPALTLMVSLADPLRSEKGVLPRAWIAGLDDRPEVVATGGRHIELDLKLTPLGGHVLCGMPLRELRGQIVPLDELFGVEGRLLAERLSAAPDWDTRFDIVERLLLHRAADGSYPDPFVLEALSRLQASSGRLRIDRLATSLNVSRRHLSSRFHDQLGLPPKALAGLLRFDLARRWMSRNPVAWADIAASCGYADQSHFNREFRRLGGTTPSSFLARQLPDGGTVGDGITFVQDAQAAAT
jgi:AraC-like DNA-binding protein